MTLQGKGFFIWQVPRCENGQPSAIAARAAAAGLSHVLVKIADGHNRPYNINAETREDLVPAVRDALRQAGVAVWGWHYVRGDRPVAEAELAVRRMQELGLDGFVVNAEIEYKQRGRREAAKRYMTLLREGLPEVPIALSTFRFPTHHRAFPFAEFLELCDYAMPQVYFEKAHNPELQLERSIEEYSVLRPARPIVPTAPAYATSAWRPTGDELKRFFAKAKAMGLSAVNAWSWDYATRPAFLEYWQSIAEFEWPAPTQGSDLPDRLVIALNERDPGQAAELYRPDAAHVSGAQTLVGRAAIQDWYTRLLEQKLPNAVFELTGRSGAGNSMHFTWGAHADSGAVLDGSDTLGLREGLIQYHYTYFSVH